MGPTAGWSFSRSSIAGWAYRCGLAMPVTRELLEEIALSEKEYRLIVEGLDREPNPLELGMFGALWSEHCGYKHSRPLLGLLPSSSPRVLLPAGQENAGAVDIGDGLAVVFKIESHNHPSAVEPFQGAATGVGGIVRDVLAMGARPIALLNSLRFGPLDQPHNRHLFHGVVGGISWYGNCIGVPDVGGEVLFSPSYSQNPLVNALCAGLIEKERLVSASVGDEGNVLLLVGAETGRDGIHGASGLASRTFEKEREMRPTVQVANPFLEKVLIEACLEAAVAGCLEGMQDLGAAGLTTAAVESAARDNAGIKLDISRVHRRDTGMDPYEVMLSESQERMLLVVKRDRKAQVGSIFQKWDIPCVEIGTVTSTGEAWVHDEIPLVAQLPINLLTDPPRYKLKGAKPPRQTELQRYPLGSVPLERETPARVLLRLLGSPNIGSKEQVYRQYDHQVQTNTVVAPGGDAAVLRIKGTRKGIALCTDGNGRHCYLDPYRGGAIAVAEACRNLSCTGAEPIALTDCLNFGNPEHPEIYYQLEWCIRGMAEACRVLGVPVVSGNVSLYNETQGQAVYPTPVVGALGLLEDVRLHVTSAFNGPGEVVALLGAVEVRGRAQDLAGSEYLEVVHGTVAGRPAIDLGLEKRVQMLCRRAVREGVVSSAHDCSDGGLAVALVESCIAGGVGFRGDFGVRGRWDAALFGEAQSRVVVSLRSECLRDLATLATELDVPLTSLGVTIPAPRFTIDWLLDLPLEELGYAWSHALDLSTL